MGRRAAVLSKFFIDRPIFASVISIVITLAGAVSAVLLPVAQYPEITPPTVSVTCQYPGASAKVVADTVAAPIEQQIVGVENMLYMSSQCTNDGTYNLTVTFALGTDPNMDQVLVQNRVAIATPTLPDVVKSTGVTTKKKSPAILLVVNMISPSGKYSQLYLSNYATIYVRDELSRLAGVGDVTYLGQQDYSMRVWLDPEKLAARNMTAGDVVSAVKEQNVQVAAGQIGQQPVPKGLDFQYTMSTLGRLDEADQFANIVIKTGKQGEVTHLRDVARIELGSKNQDITNTLDGQPSVGLAVYSMPGSNALETADRIQAKMEELKTRFPSGLEYRVIYDTTPFINESIHEVYKTLGEAIVLVAIVVLVFLQNWRSTLIPLIAVPVAIVGTFAIMMLMGFSLNNLSLFGLVLAIGIVVDDAIVVVEAVEHHIEHGMTPYDATVKAMSEVSGPVIAVSLVLCAVFVPCAFISGITGQFFRQFALTIAVSTALSALNSLTLSPALSALLLKPHDESTKREPLPRLGIAIVLAGIAFLVVPDLVLARSGMNLTNRWTQWTVRFLIAAPFFAAGLFGSGLVNRPLSWFFALFNRGFTATTNVYTKMVGGLLRTSLLVLAVYGGLLYLTYHAFSIAPTGFIPMQDKGYMLVNVQLPDSASLERTQEVLARIERIALGDNKEKGGKYRGDRPPDASKFYDGIPGIAHTIGIAGQSVLLNANGSNFGSMYITFEPFHERHAPDLYSDVIISKLRAACAAEVPDAVVAAFGAPPVDGLGSAGGFKFFVEDIGSNGLDTLQEKTDDLVKKGNKTPGLVGLFTSFRSNTPQLYVDVDREKCKTLGLALNDVFTTLQVYLGGYYVNDFNKFGRTWQVNLQADAPYRLQANDVRELKVRNASGQMVPLGTVADIQDVGGPVMVARYNTYVSAAVNGSTAPGTSTGQAIAAVKALADNELPKSMSFEWTELTYMQILAGNTAMIVFAIGTVLVFLVLSAQYENWSLPFAVILVVPMCLLCSIVGVLIAKMDVNIFTQIGFVVLVGLASKNAILIVEFAKAEREAGKPRYESTISACDLRLRPILMTSFAFILGVVPLVVSKGAGAEMRRTLGTAVFSGMLGVTFFGIFLTPVFFYVIEWFGDRGKAAPKARPIDERIPVEMGHGDGDGVGSHNPAKPVGH
jgi:multidrug efflux pump subunit AcrB